MKTAKTIMTVFLMLVSGITMAQTGKWFPVPGANLNGNLNTIAFNGDTLYVGGSFTMAGGITANHVAKWDGSTWSTIGTGFDGRVLTFLFDGGYIYAGGNFNQAGGITANNIARWNGTSWDTLGSGFNNSIWGITTDGTYIYAGGSFTTAGGSPIKGIAKWDGTSWSSVNSNITYPSCLTQSGSDLYVGGTFGSPGSRITKWDGTSWSGLGTGVNFPVGAIEIAGNDLYAGGNFTMAGGNPANKIAKWDGTNWSALGSGLNNYVHAIETFGYNIYAGGEFTTAGGNPANHIARWDGTSWDSLGSGFESVVNVLVYHKNCLYAGGEFTMSGGDTVNYLARYVFAPTSPYGLSSSLAGMGGVTLTWSDSSDYEDGFVIERKYDTDTNWTVVDTTGAGIAMYTDSGLASGTYQYRVYSFNEGGNSSYSDTTMANIPVPPLPPHSLSLNVLDTGIVKLTWADSSNSEDGFVLERKDNVDTNWTAIDSLEADSVTYTDSGLTVGRTYEWRVYAFNAGGNSGYSNVVSSLITGIAGNSSLPDKYALYSNYPNPFNPSTKIKFDIPKSGIVKLTIYDILGRQVSTLINSELTAGRYEMEWNAGSYSSGIYFYRIEADGFVETRRMMLIK